MLLKEVSGDLLMSDCDVICHQVNCQGIMNFGISKAIKKKYPLAYEQYSKFLYQNTVIKEGIRLNSKEFLGLCQISKVEDHKYVASLYAQNSYGVEQGKVYTNYDALLCSLFALRRLVLFGDYGIKSIAFPFYMGCGRGGGGDWERVKGMIESVFNDLDITIEICKLPRISEAERQ